MRSPEAAFDLRAALSNELRAAVEELESSAGRAKAVHRCRVRIKRARALARVGRACAPGLSAVFNDSARAVMRMLARRRDLAALAEAARAVGAKARKREAAALTNVASALDAEHAVMTPLDLEQARNGLRDLVALAQVWPEASARQIGRGARRIVRRARRAYRRGAAADDVRYRHEWRKREKDRYYAAQLLNDAWPKRRRRKLGAKLGEVLGDERDALLLIERISNDPALAGADKAPVRALKALNRRRRKLAERADEIGARVHRGGA
jgi:hypothetical protein